MGCIHVVLILGLSLAPIPSQGEEKTAKSPRPREALKAFNDLVGVWKGTGIPEKIRNKKPEPFWSDKLSWAWRFQADDAWMTVRFEKSKLFASGDLRYLPEKDLFQLTLQGLDNKTSIYQGTGKDRQLVLEHRPEGEQGAQRIVLTLLHSNRFVYRLEVQKEAEKSFTRLFQVGATKEGTSFAAGTGQPECIVTGGLGTKTVSYKGKTYHVCCTGCRDAFLESPDKYIKEFEEKNKADKK